ncbi:MAG: hypothetical protein ACOX6V_01630 [Patescibacteria group bacterium]|jgi:tRNA U34 5-carboxymethylaminomethyl modifying enzyme MnmG/GidA
MKRGVWIIAVGFFLASCVVKTPITATQEWLQLLKNQQFEQATQHMVVITNQTPAPLTQEQKDTFIAQYQQNYQQIHSFSVDNMVALPEQTLKEMGIGEGYEVYYVQTSQKKGKQHLKTFVVKVGDQWKVVKK